MKRTALETLWGECGGSLLLGDERAAREASIYFCCLSFQGSDWQLFLEPESHSMLNRTSGEEEEGEGIYAHKLTPTHTHGHPRLHTLHVMARSHQQFQAQTHTWTSAYTCAKLNATHGAEQYVPRFVAGCHTCTDGSCVGCVTAVCLRERGMERDLH